MVEWLKFILITWDWNQTEVERRDFLDLLSVAPTDDVTLVDNPTSPKVELLFVAREDFENEKEPGEAFAAALDAGLLRVAEWLSRQPVKIFEDLRGRGLKTEILVTGWLAQDQFDLHLPPELLKACGTLGLTMYIYTNE